MPDTINSHQWSIIEEYCNALKAFEGEAPCDFPLRTKMKSKIRWRRFDNVEKVQEVSQRVLDKITRNDFQKSFEMPCYHWKQRHNYFGREPKLGSYINEAFTKAIPFPFDRVNIAA